MKAYLTQKNTPNRMTRKRARRDIFIQNKKAARTRRKLQRQQRAELEGA